MKLRPALNTRSPAINTCLDILVQQYFQHDGGFKHPGNRSPKFAPQHAKRMLAFLRHGVRAELGEKVCRFLGGQPGRGGCSRRICVSFPHGLLLADLVNDNGRQA